MAYVNENGFFGTGYTFIFLSIIAVTVRFSVRSWKKVAIGVDDWFSLLAVVFTIAYCVTVIIGTSQHVIGGHGNDEALQIKMFKITKATGTLRNPAIGTTKLSVLFLYRRVFQVHNQGFKRALWITIAICVYEPGYNVTQAVLDVVMDVILITLPLPMVWSLHMEARRKILVSLVFVVGMFSVVAAVLRLIYVLAHAKMIVSKTSTDILGVKTSDKIGSQSLIIFWNVVELGVGIIATCMPAFSPLFFESEAALWSLKATLSGFAPLIGKDYVSEKSRETNRQDSAGDGAESNVGHESSVHSVV